MPKKARDQLDLFGTPSPSPTQPPPDAARPGPAAFEVPAETSALAHALDPLIRLGTSSWTFPGWAGLCYPPATTEAQLMAQGLAMYSRWPLFRTVGIDRSYYRPIPRDELAAYAAQLPPGFRCIEKVWDGVTAATFPDHAKHGARAGRPNERFLDPSLFLEAVWAPHVGTFEPHVAAFVLELPPIPAAHRPTPDAFARRLDDFLAAMPAGLRFAVELRNEQLLTEPYLAVLRARNAAHVFNLWTWMPRPGGQFARTGFTADFAVARLLQPPGTRYDERKDAFAPFDRVLQPDDTLRDEVAAIATHAIAATVPLWTIVNNKSEGSAPLTVEAIARRVVEAQRGGQAVP